MSKQRLEIKMKQIENTLETLDEVDILHKKLTNLQEQHTQNPNSVQYCRDVKPFQQRYYERRRLLSQNLSRLNIYL